MRINDLENRSGLERATIRYYEKEGLITPVRSENGYRDYSEEDLIDLKKIKLLRQLGLSLERIRMLKQGSDDFGAAIEAQLAVLEQEIDSKCSARAVCLQLQADAATYDGMDADRYLAVLNQLPPKLPPWAPRPVPAQFREDVPKEFHPVRRYIARHFDHFLLSVLLYVIVFSVFRVRALSIGLTISTLSLILCFSWWLMIPIEAAFLRFLGTTPGKWIMGIHLQSQYGGKMYYSVALYRSWRVFCHGMGLNISFWKWIRLYQSYVEHNDNGDLDWDDEVEITYRAWSWKRVIALVLAIVAICSMFFLASCDLLLPVHRGGKLTLEKFVDNYNSYVCVLGDGRTGDQKNKDGTWKIEKGVAFSNSFGEYTVNQKPERFVYELDHGILKSVTYTSYWMYGGTTADSEFMSWDLSNNVPEECDYAVYAVIGAQAWMNPWKFSEFMAQYENAQLTAPGEMTMEYGNAIISWKLWTEPYEPKNDFYMEYNGSPVTDYRRTCIELTITIR